MEPPPTKEEILLEWFLGDSKEITADLKTAMADAQGVRAGIDSAGRELDATVQAAKRELVTAHRELAQVVREARTANAETGKVFLASAHRATVTGVRRSLPMIMVCSGVSAVIGSAVGASLAMMAARWLG
ncbi:plasmid stabilization protein StbC [Caballeronia sp. LP003]|uniref:plasmid stabilization protein StbC n=1 Tax=Caballeronia sp. LP003 TaxID=3038551 RepID=UPI0028616B10|nr:plasmid stabilization protein StbC [Caballeronia sp. LP003]MDR5785249.1 plasmid stabilization protein StbC [Caballeronia sp. LP003]